jgi:hypothetical protein
MLASLDMTPPVRLYERSEFGPIQMMSFIDQVRPGNGVPSKPVSTQIQSNKKFSKVNISKPSPESRGEFLAAIRFPDLRRLGKIMVLLKVPKSVDEVRRDFLRHLRSSRLGFRQQLALLLIYSEEGASTL